MGSWIDLDTPHGRVRAWHSTPSGERAGALVVIQEIFGVNTHIRDVADRFAKEGFEVVAPSLFDPVEPNVQLDYDAAGMAHGRELVGALGIERAVDIVEAAAGQLRTGTGTSKVGVVGFCWGGSVALLANTRLGLPASSYYGARSVGFLGEPLRAPMQFHFGARDSSIPAADIQKHRDAYPDAETYVYDAGHGFNCDRRADYDAAAAALAWTRTTRFFRDALA
ncbi:dienelactone hydrolase family protein [Cognatilysobacter lacus]|uniref:Dienelactone hydrolase family protein n=1 Tax=Cognatilysobacter lacus TaxID=1643323 RepID=A0A5D8Z5Y8_9GAMM|nr:dienelactone hydrolase family protein [Lysobacter lacus]TZF90159.1 dienelactone hydrolase family protein [Lysobacter lacus]